MRAAIVVGCSAYDDEQIANLKYAHRDAELLSEALELRCGVATENLYLIAGRDRPGGRHPTRSELIRVLSKGPAVAARQSIETLFLVFSGHGCHSVRSGMDYLLLADTVHAAIEETAIEFGMIETLLRRWKADRTVIIMDACREYFDQSKSVGTLDAAQELKISSVEGMIVLRSCSPGERSYELEDQECGLFTSALRESLSDQGKCATYYELDQFLPAAIQRLCHKYDKPTQRPLMRVEPVSAQAANLVSAEQAVAWQRQRPFGQEAQPAVVEMRQQDGPWSDLIGIDFGTTSCLISVLSVRLDEARLVSVGGRKQVPTVLSFRPDLSYVVGGAAEAELAHNRAASFAYFKRSLGSGKAVNVGGRSITSEQAAGLIIASLKRRTEDFTGQRARRVFASCPVNFSSAQANGLAEAFVQAGFDEIRFVPEPCAASLTLVRTHFPRATSLRAIVIDLGGGTFDVAGIVMSDLVSQVIVTSGDRNIGGRDYDRILADLIRDNAIAAGVEESVLNETLLLAEGERCKILLGRHSEVQILLDIGETGEGSRREFQMVITRDVARERFASLDDRLMAIVNVVRERFLEEEPHIDVVALAGMGAKVFSIHHRLELAFAGIEVSEHYSENAVAVGLGEYLRTLGRVGGAEGKWLLINNVGRDLLVSCARYVDGQVYLGGELRENAGTALLFPNGDPIPMLRAYDLILSDGIESHELKLFERFPSDADPSLVSTFVIGAGVKRMLLSFEFDTEGALCVNFIGADSADSFQLTQLHREPTGYELEEAVPATKGWRVEASRGRRVRSSDARFPGDPAPFSRHHPYSRTRQP